MKPVFLAAVALGLMMTPVFAQSVPELPFESVPNPLKLPNDIHLGEFGWIHAIACPSEDEIWVGELINWRVQKLVTKGTARR